MEGMWQPTSPPSSTTSGTARVGHHLVLITGEQGQEGKNDQQYTETGNPVEKVKSHQDAFSPTADLCFSLHSLDYHVIKRQLT